MLLEDKTKAILYSSCQAHTKNFVLRKEGMQELLFQADQSTAAARTQGTFHLGSSSSWCVPQQTVSRPTARNQNHTLLWLLTLFSALDQCRIKPEVVKATAFSG